MCVCECVCYGAPSSYILNSKYEVMCCYCNNIGIKYFIELILRTHVWYYNVTKLVSRYLSLSVLQCSGDFQSFFNVNIIIWQITTVTNKVSKLHHWANHTKCDSLFSIPTNSITLIVISVRNFSEGSSQWWLNLSMHTLQNKRREGLFSS